MTTDDTHAQLEDRLDRPFDRHARTRAPAVRDRLQAVGLA